VLVSDLKRLADADRRTRDFTVNALRRAVVEIVARFPVYRSYIDDAGVAPDDLRLIEETVEKAKRSSTLPDRMTHDFIAGALLGRIAAEGPGRPDPELLRRFRRRFQQLTGPVMAKSLEDTLFYRFVRLLALNEVGGNPGHFGLPLPKFHEAVAEQARTWPHAMIATATHDTKRGEDARGRLLALSEMPDAWADAVERFEHLARPSVVAVEESEAPDANDRYMLLQTLLGAWPNELMGDGGDAAAELFRERIKEYARKALREAKRHSSWVNVNEAYEQATFDLLRRLLEPGSEFLSAFRPLARRLAYQGMLTGLARTALKCTLPGVPDVYQGTEFWDLSLVDPDNRRPVDYGARAAALDETADLSALLQSWQDGRVKQQLLARLLADRAAAPDFYARADYRPLAPTGSKARHLVAFQRSLGNGHLVVAVPRLVARHMEGETPPLGREFWEDTALRIPAGRWRDVVTGTGITSDDKGISVGELFSALPIAVLRTME
jgi:(1->4)-alpha-D-glucan 1-alpha-D-glucosylmutase